MRVSLALWCGLGLVLTDHCDGHLRVLRARTAAQLVWASVRAGFTQRFDLVLVLVDSKNDEWDKRVSEHLLFAQARDPAALGPWSLGWAAAYPPCRIRPQPWVGPT